RGRGAAGASTSGSARDAADKNSSGKALHNVLGHRVAGDTDDPRGSKGHGTETNPGAASQSGGCGEQPEDKIYGTIQDPVGRHWGADSGGGSEWDEPHHGPA
ncbi:MAG: hypothetical protein ACK53Y_08570, partial [bacterium]